MKKIVIIILLAALFFVTGCKEKSNTPFPNESFRVSNLTHSGCKDEVKSDEQEYIAYKTINDYYLDMHHVNAVFNCCADHLIVDSKVSNDTIYIYEDEVGQDCYCVCKYDLNYEVGPLEYQEYVVKVYKYNVEHAQFTIDFNENTEGTFYIE